jgi:hypothetical protein
MQREEALSDDNYQQWVEETGLRKKQIVSQDCNELIKTPEVNIS